MKKILQELKRNNSFLLICHLSPDCDTLGSAAALALTLNGMGKRAVCAVDGLIPHKLDYALGDVRFLQSSAELPQDIDCAVAVDTATFARLGCFAEAYQSAPMRLNIDHHITNERYGMVNYVEDRAAVGEIIFQMIETLGCPVTREIANALYAAISTDTGNFAYSNVTADTLRIAAQLKEYGAESAKLCETIYNSRTLGATKLIGKALSHLHLYHDGRLAMLHMTLHEIAECGASRTDCDVLVNYARDIETVEIGVFINEMPDGKYKVSLRSKNYADVAAFAAEYGGGGHVRAAGCVFAGTVDAIEAAVVKKAEEYLQ